LIAQVYNISLSDNNGEWRRNEAHKLRDKVRQRIHEMQNPSQCSKARKILCDLNKACGFGCQMHHVMYCFITAYFTNRTLILESNGWRYNSAGYEAYFKPLSDTCLTGDAERTLGWNDANAESAQAVRMPIIDVMSNRPKFLPLSVPKEFVNDLNKFHGDPFVWWSGQILSFLMRYNQEFEKTIQSTRNRLKFKSPCVG
jgi:glycoprotein 6-alpha-L-fucosyltransferase